MAIVIPEPSPKPDPPRDRLAQPMFSIAFFHLAFVAGLIHRSSSKLVLTLENQIIFGGLAVLWVIITLEALFRLIFLAQGVRGKEVWRTLLIILLPPFRMGMPSLIRRGQIWFPFVGWRDLDKRLPDILDLYFAGPMILFAVLVIPLLLVEYFRGEAIRQNPWLSFTWNAGIATIWIAFALEFILKISVAPRPFTYMKEQWIDLAIVVIPMFTFLLSTLANLAMVGRLLRLFRVLNPQYIARMGKVYRLRGLAGRAWASVLTLGLVDRALGKDPIRAKLEKMLQEEALLENELADLRERIAELRRVLADRDGKSVDVDQTE